MIWTQRVLMVGLVAAIVPLACNEIPSRLGNGTSGSQPDPATDFSVLYAQNCAGCHGEGGRGGASIALADPVYLAIASDEVLHKAISNGIPGTPMPAFAESAGGFLTEDQVSALVKGIRGWAERSESAAAQPPPYSADMPGHAQRGAQVFRTFCSSCHGLDGKGGKKAGSLVDPSYLALVSNQGLRTLVIAGRPEFGFPDWEADLPGHPMTDEEVTNVVAWLEAQRVPYPGQPYAPSKEGPAAEGAKP
jgi:cytochrome c oxidase cbb3-type subunit III